MGGGRLRAVMAVLAVFSAAFVLPPRDAGGLEPAALTGGETWSMSAESVKPVVPHRVLDTRNGTGAPAGVVGAGAAQSFDLDVTGNGGVPETGVGAVVLNVTVTQPTRTSYLTVWPTGAPRPTASSLNMVAGQTVGNLVLARVGDGGKVSFFNNAGSTHVVADVMGWAPAGALLEPMVPERLLDTRDGNGAPLGPVGPGQSIRVPILGRAGIPATGVDAVVLNVTTVEPTRTSYVTVWPGDQPRPTAANLNMAAGEVVGNLVLAKVAPDGTIDLYNNAGSTHLVADVTAWVPQGSPLRSIVPQRLLDTRDGTGSPAEAMSAGSTITLAVAGVGDIPVDGVGAVLLSVTAVAPTRVSYVTVWPGDATRPLAASLNMAAGQTVNKLVLAKLSEDGTVDLYNNAGTVHLVADAVGWIADIEAHTTAVAHSTTVIAEGEEVTGSETTDEVTAVTLAAGVPPPGVGGELFVPPTPNAPEGVLGTVTGVTAEVDGTTIVETIPATLEDAFSDFDSTFRGPSSPLIDEAGTAPASPRAAPSAASADWLSGWKVKLLDPDGGLSCSGGSTSAPTLTFDLTFENTFVDWSFSLRNRSARFVMTTTPTLSGEMAADGSLSCTYKFDLPFKWPILGTPFLIDVSVKATLTLSAAADLSASAGSVLTLGFDYRDGEGTNLSDTGFVGAANAIGTFSLDLSDTVALGIKLAGRIGLEIGFGLKLGAEVTASGSGNCLTVDLTPFVTVSVTADVWLRDWTITVAKFEGEPAILHRSSACDPFWTGTLTLTPGADGPQTDAVVTIHADGSMTWSGTYLEIDPPSWHGPAHECGEGYYTHITMAGYEKGGDAAVGDPKPVENGVLVDLPNHAWGNYGGYLFDPPPPNLQAPYWMPPGGWAPEDTYFVTGAMFIPVDYWNGCEWTEGVADLPDIWNCAHLTGSAQAGTTPLVGQDTSWFGLQRAWELTWQGVGPPPNGDAPYFCPSI